MIDNDQSPMTTCPICQGPYKRRTQWQETCSPACRRKKFQINMVKKILDHVVGNWQQSYSETYAELEARIKAGVKL